MNDKIAMAGRTSPGVATILLMLLLLTNGCVGGTKRTVAGASTLSYVPYRAATKPVPPTPYQAEPCFFGYHGTCWRTWPEGWIQCPTFESVVEEVRELPAPETVPAPAPATEPAPGGAGETRPDDTQPAPPMPAMPAGAPTPDQSPGPVPGNQSKGANRFRMFGASGTPGRGELLTA